MSNVNDSESVVLHYFVDEAGDPTLFARRRRPSSAKKAARNTSSSASWKSTTRTT